MKYAIIALLALSACGSSQPQPIPVQLQGGNIAPSIISVTLDDIWNQTSSNQSVELTDSRYFTPPSAVNLVQGSYCGSNPGQYLHARLTIGTSGDCEYQNTGVNDPVLSLQSCSGGIGPSTYLPAETVITLYNYDAPGYLVEAKFELSK